MVVLEVLSCHPSSTCRVGEVQCAPVQKKTMRYLLGQKLFQHFQFSSNTTILKTLVIKTLPEGESWYRWSRFAIKMIRLLVRLLVLMFGCSMIHLCGQRANILGWSDRSVAQKHLGMASPSDLGLDAGARGTVFQGKPVAVETDDDAQDHNRYLNEEKMKLRIEKIYSASHLTSGRWLILVLLDWTAACDTVDRSIWSSRLQRQVGIGGTVLEWLGS